MNAPAQRKHRVARHAGRHGMGAACIPGLPGRG